MDVEPIVDPDESCRDHKWLPISDKSYVANKSLIEYSIDLVRVVNAALRQSFESGS